MNGVDVNVVQKLIYLLINISKSKIIVFERREFLGQCCVTVWLFTVLIVEILRVIGKFSWNVNLSKAAKLVVYNGVLVLHWYMVVNSGFG